ncbi:hypothetical protein C0991_001969, partial [Blastosporella zonata]
MIDLSGLCIDQDANRNISLVLPVAASTTYKFAADSPHTPPTQGSSAQLEPLLEAPLLTEKRTTHSSNKASSDQNKKRISYIGTSIPSKKVKTRKPTKGSVPKTTAVDSVGLPDEEDVLLIEDS